MLPSVETTNDWRARISWAGDAECVSHAVSNPATDSPCGASANSSGCSHSRTSNVEGLGDNQDFQAHLENPIIESYIEIKTDPADIGGAFADGVGARIWRDGSGGQTLNQVGAVLTRGAATAKVD